MASGDDGQEKTEQASARKRAEARREGQIPRSQDLTAAVTLLIAMLLLHTFGGRIVEAWLLATRFSLSPAADGFGGNPTRPDDLLGLIMLLGRLGVGSLTPLLLMLLAAVLIVTVSQVGFLLTGKGLIPKLSKLNPIKGLKNIVNLRAGVRLGMSIGKLLLLAGIAGIVIAFDLEKLLILSELPPKAAYAAAIGLVLKLGLILAAVLVVLAVIDYVYQRWQHEQDLKMTKQEARQEAKDMDGDPMLKQRRRQIARQLAMQRMAAAVPKADVIVTNPTHLSIALKYDGRMMAAPKVIAKGADHMALQIRQIAARHGVPVIERKPLARALYATVDVGQEVPPEHFAAIAEILAYVYRLTGRVSA